MNIDKNRKSVRGIYRIAAWFCLTVVILATRYFGYYKYWESKLQPPEGFSIEVSTKDLVVVGAKWLQPGTPYYEKGQLFLLIGQGDQGDFKGGNVMANTSQTIGERPGSLWNW